MKDLKNICKRGMALLLTLVMLMGMLPTTAFAATSVADSRITFTENNADVDGFVHTASGLEQTIKGDTNAITIENSYEKDVLVDPTVPENERPEGGGDGITDKHQATVKFTSNGGTATLTGETTTVVTLYKNGKYATAAEDGKGKLAESQIPAVSAKDDTYGDPVAWTVGADTVSAPTRTLRLRAT